MMKSDAESSYEDSLEESDSVSFSDSSDENFANEPSKPKTTKVSESDEKSTQKATKKIAKSSKKPTCNSNKPKALPKTVNKVQASKISTTTNTKTRVIYGDSSSSVHKPISETIKLFSPKIGLSRRAYEEWGNFKYYPIDRLKILGVKTLQGKDEVIDQDRQSFLCVAPTLPLKVLLALPKNLYQMFSQRNQERKNIKVSLEFCYACVIHQILKMALNKDQKAIYESITSDNTPQRESGIKQLECMSYLTAEQMSELVRFMVLTLSEDNELKWHTLFGCLSGVKVLTNKIFNDFDTALTEAIFETACKYTRHLEFRVQIAATELLSTLLNMIRDDGSKLKISVNLLCSYINSSVESSSSLTDIKSEERIIDKEKLLHEASKWKRLENSIRTLSFLFSKLTYKNAIDYILNKDMVDMLQKVSLHENRFVKEAMYQLLDRIFGMYETSNQMIEKLVVSIDLKEDFSLLEDSCYDLIKVLLISGMCDNSSQVRMAASTAARKFLVFVMRWKNDNFLIPLLMIVCLNRHYSAVGIKEYSVATWKLVMKNGGANFVRNHMDEFVEFYKGQLVVDNCFVREAVCHCLTEIIILFEPEDISRKIIDCVLECVNTCLNDQSWCVRDTACIAIGHLAMKYIPIYPTLDLKIIEICKQYVLEFLNDSIASLRKAACVTLARMFTVLPDFTHDIVEKFINGNILCVRDQKPSSEDVNQKREIPGIIKIKLCNLEEENFSTTRHLCSDFIGRSNEGVEINNSNCLINSSQEFKQDWEKSDDCLSLLGILCYYFSRKPQTFTNISSPSLSLDDEMREATKAKELLKLIIKEHTEKALSLLKYRQYSHHIYVFTTLFEYMPCFVEFYGIRDFKRDFLTEEDTLIEPISYSQSICNNPRLNSGVSKFVKYLSSVFGENMIKSKLLNFQMKTQYHEEIKQ